MQERKDGIRVYPCTALHCGKCTCMRRDNNRRDAYLHIFHRSPVTRKLDVGMHLVCYRYYTCLRTFWPYHPYLFL